MSKDSAHRVSSVPWEQVAAAARIPDRALNLTHPLYRYPASMSPALVRALILGLTKKGDTVLDPFCGGGTTAVESLAHGRNVICSDLNTLACFVTEAKAKQMNHIAIEAYEQWATRINKLLRSEANRSRLTRNYEDEYVYAPRTHALVLALRDSATRISNTSARRFAILVVLRVAQLCFDRTTKLLRPAIVARAFDVVSSQSTVKMQQYTEMCHSNAARHESMARIHVFNCDAQVLPDKLANANSAISLVLTSPPYPGVHVLYHRWQIHGRHETDLPYDLIGQSDGRYESSYTLGPRNEVDNDKYFQRLEAIYNRLREVLSPATWIAQAVAFSKPKNQLARFREVMSSAGFEEVLNPGFSGRPITRKIPNRRWYALLSANQNSAQEYLLIHRPHPR